MKSAFKDSLMVSGGGWGGNTRELVWLLYSYQVFMRYKIKKKIWHNLSGLQITDRNSKNHDFGNAVSRHIDVTTFSRIINNNIKNWSWNFRPISPRMDTLQNNVKCRKKPGLGNVTSPWHSLGDVISSIFRHWPSFKSFW